MKSLAVHLVYLFRQETGAHGLWNAIRTSAVTVWRMALRNRLRDFLKLEIVQKYIANSGNGDVFFPIRHRFYLSSSFGRVERIDAALGHYRYEEVRYSENYRRTVYGGNGLELWSERIEGSRYAIKLRSATDLRHEGAISIELWAGDAELCTMAYVWIDAVQLGLGAGMVPFITRNQGVRKSSVDLAQFRRDFPHNSPSYFCLAAIHGMALATHATRIAGIRHDHQVAFEERYVDSFRRSYCDFWRSFGGEERGSIAYEMPVPLMATPLEEVKGKHRQRAIARRNHWATISRSAQKVVAAHAHPPPNVALPPRTDHHPYEAPPRMVASPGPL